MAGAKHGPLWLCGGRLRSARRGWGVVEDFLEEAELEIGRKKNVRQGGRLNEVHNSAGDLSHVSCFLEEHSLTK